MKLSYVWCHQHQSLQKDPPQILPTTLPRKKNMNAWHIDTCNYPACSCNLRHEFALYMFSSCMQGSGTYMHACMHACMVIFQNAHAFELLFFIGVARLRMSSAPPGLSPSSTDSSFKHPSSTPLVLTGRSYSVESWPNIRTRRIFTSLNRLLSPWGRNTNWCWHSWSFRHHTTSKGTRGRQCLIIVIIILPISCDTWLWLSVHACMHIFLQLRFTTWARVRLWIRAFSITTCTESKHTNHGSTLYIIRL